MARVLFDHVTKRFGEVIAVNDMTLEIPDGAFLVFVGPSGCGKTTSLRLLAGLEEPDVGNISIGGKRVNDTPPHARDTAIVFQNYALYPHMTAYENMGFGLRMRGVSRSEIDRRVREAADVLGIAYLLDRRPRGMSGGERQRVALGRAVVRSPKVFLLDEPLSNLDAQLRTHMRAELIKLHRRLGGTFVYVTHDQVEAMTMADIMVIMNAGRIYQIGSPQDVYNRPQNLFVAGFIGSPAMNFVLLTLDQYDSQVFLSDGVLSIPLSASKACAVATYVGKEIIFGVRPEDIYVPPFVPEDIDPVRVRARVDVVEPVGNEIILYLFLRFSNDVRNERLLNEAERGIIVARVDPRVSVETGDEIEIVMNRSNFQYFDTITEHAI